MAIVLTIVMNIISVVFGVLVAREWVTNGNGAKGFFFFAVWLVLYLVYAIVFFSTY